MGAKRVEAKLNEAALPGRYLSVASQVASAISAGFPGVPLPGERRLALQYQVSRRTIRKALEELRIHDQRGKLHLSKPKAAAPRHFQRVALLMAEPLENLRPYTALWVHRLSERLSRSGLRLDIHHGRRFFGTASARSRDLLVKEAEASCWLLSGSNLHLQEWFQEKNIPAVIAGTPCQGVSIPGVDIDHRAMCRHAVSVLHRQRHRRVALFLENRHRQGDSESEKGFLEAASACEMDAPLIFRHELSPAAVVSAMRRALGAKEPITGYVFASPFSCLTAITYVAEIGHKVPASASIISCHEEPYLPYLRPVPAHYVFSPDKLASAICKALQRVLQGTPTSSHFIMPDFVNGASLATPPGA
jgi:DNA-binding LacI/PurR family transcriptional regulator